MQFMQTQQDRRSVWQLWKYGVSILWLANKVSFYRLVSNHIQFLVERKFTNIFIWNVIWIEVCMLNVPALQMKCLLTDGVNGPILVTHVKESPTATGSWTVKNAKECLDLVDIRTNACSILIACRCVLFRHWKSLELNRRSKNIKVRFGVKDAQTFKLENCSLHLQKGF